jgi:hypothetical protein
VLVILVMTLDMPLQVTGVGVLDPGVSRSTSSWATTMAHLRQQGAGSDFQPNKEDPREEGPLKENDIQTQKT